MNQLKDISVDIVQGEMDSVCPKEIALLLADKLIDAQANVTIRMMEGEKHTPHTPAMTDALVNLTDSFQIFHVDSRRSLNFT
jgi:predicted esterase